MTADRGPAFSRRRLLAGSAAATAAALAAAAVGPGDAGAGPAPGGDVLPFHGPHQSGIATPEQERLAFAAFDVTAADRTGLAALLATWTAAAERMTRGLAVQGPEGLSPPRPTPARRSTWPRRGSR